MVPVARLFLPWLVLIVGAGSLAKSSQEQPNSFSVEPQVTWSTAAMPEIHLLLRNATDEALEVVTELGAVPTGRHVGCRQQDARNFDPNFVDRFARWDGVSGGITRGVVPAGGWSHRSISLGLLGVLPPCEIPFRVSFVGRHGERPPIEGLIHVPDQPAPAETRGEGSGIRWRSTVERDLRFKDRILARVLVVNEGEEAVRLLVTDRRILCDGESGARWVLHRGTPQGQDIGPLEVASGSWGVFVSAIHLVGGRPSRGCRVELDIAADTNAKLRPSIRAEFALDEAGFVDAMGGE